VYIKGRHARRLVERLVTRRVSDMAEGQCRYALCLNEQGGIHDDVLVYRLDDDHFLIVVNASNRVKLLEHFERVRVAEDFNCKIDDKTEKTAMVALQGPKVMEMIASVSSEAGALKRYRFVEKNLLIAKILISRTGYTGEDGVEVILPKSFVGQALKLLLKEDAGGLVKPCGLGARDTLRLEAGMPLYGHELEEDVNALSTGLGFAMNLDKGDDEHGIPCIGLEALRETEASGGPKEVLVGLELDGKRTARQGMEITKGGQVVGRVTSGCMSPTLEKSIAMAYVTLETKEAGEPVVVACGKGIEATICGTQFYKRPKK
jgi:aminomethyltransferase